MAITVTGTLTAEVANQILTAIKGYLKNKKDKEAGGLKDNLAKLVKQSSNSSIALSRYISLNRPQQRQVFTAPS